MFFSEARSKACCEKSADAIVDTDTSLLMKKYAVDLDLERFFDTVNHSRLIELLSRGITDSRVVSFIHKYLLAGIQIGDKLADSPSGVPQGSPLSNIMLNELDKELYLRVNKEKASVGYVRGMKYLGYSFYKEPSSNT